MRHHSILANRIISVRQQKTFDLKMKEKRGSQLSKSEQLWKSRSSPNLTKPDHRIRRANYGCDERDWRNAFRDDVQTKHQQKSEMCIAGGLAIYLQTVKQMEISAAESHFRLALIRPPADRILLLWLSLLLLLMLPLLLLLLLQPLLLLYRFCRFFCCCFCCCC